MKTFRFNMANTRNETSRDRIATVIQAGHRDRKTSDEIAGEVLELIGSIALEPFAEAKAGL
jgi:hypothetical protein